MHAAAEALGLQMRVLHASSEAELASAFAALREERPSALVIGNDSFFNSRSEMLGALSARDAVPAIFQTREFAAAGGLVSYGGSLKESYRVVGVYTGRVLRGEQASELPVQQTTKVELIVNVRAARALGVTVPLALLGRADEVME
jgi:putative ABC transport system substrate-binding protein